MPTSTLNSLFVYKIDSNETIKKKFVGTESITMCQADQKLRKKPWRKLDLSYNAHMLPM